jgi:GNAT superfamily N-acetyltransferase
VASTSPYRVEPFVRSGAGYQALADLLDRVWPESPASAAWAARSDAEATGGGPVRVVAREAGVPDRLVGLAELRRHPWRDDGAHFHASLGVDPAHRRRGLGAELFSRALATLPRDRPVVVEAEGTEDRPEGIRFLEARGFGLRLRMQPSELDLGRFDPRPFEPAARRLTAEGLVLRDLGEGGARDLGLLRGLHALQASSMIDAPGATGYVPGPFERWRASYQDNPDYRPEGHAVALDGGRAVGMTQLWASQATDTLLYTGFTGVARSHRRRGIALALKAMVLSWARTLRTSRGTPPVVRAGNADGNPMLDINLRLGFAARPAVLIFERPYLPGTDATSEP